ncbi:hypothetical protein IQ268_23910 [Oculatella sp. LEGE 06141]|uniref:hypothetical protein n=1 Tax=Oculatella sp. LEGE 06141 TaxID=1828648 RepID=UPI001881C922|nr:hypothetical protein [Oculatella sp. LEGE 06141]MBE9181614.1 hypothetical protein [Oculatella sp. LEGE 06141]
MLNVLPFIDVVILMMSCYIAGFVGIGLLSAKRTRSLNPDYRLRTEIREALSCALIEIAESGEYPTTLGLIDRCPAVFSQGKAWEIWTQESYKMAMAMLPLPSAEGDIATIV